MKLSIALALQFLPVVFADDYVAKHNEFRALHGSPALVQDRQLERDAQAYANFHKEKFGLRDLTHKSEACGKNEHRNNAVCSATGQGENLAWVSNTGTMSEATDSWYEEVKDVVWSDNGEYKGETGVVGHLTALLWKSTTKVGCGQASSSDGGTLTVCRYSPPGNYVGQTANNVRDCDTNVAFKCKKNKCIAKSERCNGKANDCSMPDKWCNYFINQNKNWAKNFCTVDNSDEEGCGSNTGSSSGSNSGSSAGSSSGSNSGSNSGSSSGSSSGSTSACVDKETSSCSGWVKLGYCSGTYEAYMHENCQKSCGVCACVDKKTKTKCSKWAQRGFCSGTHEAFMHENCQKSCAACGTSRLVVAGSEIPEFACVNDNASCDAWAKAGECEKNPAYMKGSCQKSCGCEKAAAAGNAATGDAATGNATTGNAAATPPPPASPPAASPTSGGPASHVPPVVSLLAICTTAHLFF